MTGGGNDDEDTPTPTQTDVPTDTDPVAWSVSDLAQNIGANIADSVNIVITALNKVVTVLSDGNHALLVFVIMIPFGFLFVRWVFNMLHFRGK